MASLTVLPSGNWRVQVRRRGRYATRTFREKGDAETWSRALEREIDLTTRTASNWDRRTFSELIDIYLQDMQESGRHVTATRRLYLDSVRSSLGKLKISDLTRENFLKYGKERAKNGAGPATVLQNFSHLNVVMTHAESVHGVPFRQREFALARTGLRSLGLLKSSRARTRRPTTEELQRLTDHFASNPRQLIPMDRVIQFAIATAMREAEIFHLEWTDVDLRRRLITIRDRKTPHDKRGNHEVIPMLDLTGYDPLQLLLAQKIITRGKGRVFPHCPASASMAFYRACNLLKIENLRFHDLRREAASRLFEAGLTIEQVALVTGHKDWGTLRRYTKLKPEDLVRSHLPADESVAHYLEQLLNT